MKRALKIIGLVLGVILMIPIVALIVTTWVYQPIPDGRELSGGARVVKDGYVSLFVLPAGEGAVALVDCGNDEDGKALLAELSRRKLGPEAVKALFLTHGHSDHTAGCHLFPHADVYAMANEANLVDGRSSGRGPLPRLIPGKDRGLRITIPLADGDVVTTGTLRVTAFAVPGHTPGSAAYLAEGVLYLGDSGDAKKDGTMASAAWLFSDDTDQNRASLKRLASRLAPREGEVKALAFAHTGVLEGFAPLKALSER